MKPDLKNDSIKLASAIAAAIIMALNIQTFVNTCDLYPGGFTGLAVLIQRIFSKYLHIKLSYTIVNLALNAVPIYIGFRYIGKKFTLFSFVMIFTNSILVDIIPTYVITSDILLISIFGGIINGFAISICLNAGTSSGGTDFISIYFSRKRGVDSFNLGLWFNIVVLSIAGLLFGWDKALYSIIFQFASTQVIHLLYRNYQQMTLFVVTKKPHDVSELIYKFSNHGATILYGEGSHDKTERPIVYSVVDSPDAKKIIREIKKFDPDAFINCIRTNEIKGNFYFEKKE